MTGLVGVASLTGTHGADDLHNYAAQQLEHQHMLGEAAPLVDVRGCSVGLNRSDGHPDPFQIRCVGARLLIGQARPLRVRGRAQSSAGPVSDLFDAWTTWGPDGLHRIEGDFLLVEWDGDRRRLSFARAPVSEFTLYVRVVGGLVRFSTLASALESREPDLAYLANQFSGKAIVGTVATAFAGVRSLRPARLTTYTLQGRSERTFWSPSDEIGQPLPDVAAADRLREAMFAATGELMAGQGSIVASHLSAGRDSGATTSVAADILSGQGRRLLACTAVPIPGYDDIEPVYLYDEGDAAAVVAGHWSNVTHRRVRVAPVALGALLDRYNAVLPSGHGTPVALPWWSAILTLAAEEGATTLLSGGMGNLTISSGGPWVLPDVLRSGRLFTFAKALATTSKGHNASWRNLIANAALPFLPATLGRSLERRRRGIASEVNPFFRGALAMAAGRQDAEDRREPVPFYREQQCDQIAAYDLADQEPWALHRIVLRDPTGDRRVIQAALSLTPEQIVSAYERRPIFERAFAGVMPISALRQPRRGHQAADWNQVIELDELKQSVRRYSEHALVRELIATDALLLALDHWPSGICVSGPTYQLFLGRVLPAISISSFLALHFPS